jgi:hypothetical protein
MWWVEKANLCSVHLAFTTGLFFDYVRIRSKSIVRANSITGVAKQRLDGGYARFQSQFAVSLLLG